MEKIREHKDRLELIGTRIRDVRLFFRLKLNEMAEKCGLSVSYLSDIELGKKRPHIDLIMVLAQEFGVDLNYLFLGTGDMFQAKKEQTRKSREFDFSGEIDSLETFYWLMENSNYFNSMMMSCAMKLLLKEEPVIKASIEKKASSKRNAEEND